jgi:hypothetical protein
MSSCGREMPAGDFVNEGMAQMKKIDAKTLKTVKGGTLGLLLGGCCSPCGGSTKSKKC